MNQNDFVNEIKAMLEGAEPPISGDCCIYRVPLHIRKLKEDAYEPNIVSIGPFHHNNHPRLQNMETHKLIYCNAFLRRAEASLDSLICYIEKVEQNVRRCYSETLDLSKKELMKVVLVDSGFIIELFWRYYYRECRSSDDICFSKPWLATHIRLDLLYLENQLPFFVLDRLFNLSFRSGPNSGNIPSFLVLALRYFSYYNRPNLTADNISIRHFTDLVRTFHLQNPRETHRIDVSTIHLKSATELLEAGVRFEVNTESECLLDLEFSGRVLKIPQLKVEDWTTEILYRNMVALEQCHYPRKSYITDYITILDFLINTSRDVDVLVRKGILINWLADSDSVANLFNGLAKNIMVINFNSNYFDLCKDLNAFCRNPRHKLKASLRRDYCNTPWQTAASIAGIVLLILSFLQSVCSVLQVVQQYNGSSN